MEGLIVILLYAFKLAFLASLACVKTKVFSLKSEVKKAYLHAHKRILIMPSIMKEVYCVTLIVKLKLQRDVTKVIELGLPNTCGKSNANYIIHFEVSTVS